MEPLQQISDSELELMHIIWGAGGNALFAQVMEGLEEMCIRDRVGDQQPALPQPVQQPGEIAGGKVGPPACAEDHGNTSLGRLQKFTSILHRNSLEATPTTF